MAIRIHTRIASYIAIDCRLVKLCMLLFSLASWNIIYSQYSL